MDVDSLFAPVCAIALRAMKSKCARRRQMAVRKPRVGEESRRCNEIVFLDRRYVISSGRERVAGLVRLIESGMSSRSSRSVWISQAMRSRVQRTEPARALITSGG